MALEIIGAGFGRTSTLSLKFALEKLGWNPCYHMMEVRKNDGHAELWHQAVRNEPVDWAALFAGYRAAVDWPVAEFWPEVLAAFPGARVILTRREPEGWYRSLCNTILKNLRGPLPDDPAQKVHRLMTRHLILTRVFGGKVDEKAHAIEVFNRNIEKVIADVPADQLLIYEPGDGWPPLCEFLGVPVPDEDYPNVNSTQEFQDRWSAQAGQTGAADSKS